MLHLNDLHRETLNWCSEKTSCMYCNPSSQQMCSQGVQAGGSPTRQSWTDCTQLFSSLIALLPWLPSLDCEHGWPYNPMAVGRHVMCSCETAVSPDLGVKRMEYRDLNSNEHFWNQFGHTILNTAVLWQMLVEERDAILLQCVTSIRMRCQAVVAI